MENEEYLIGLIETFAKENEFDSHELNEFKYYVLKFFSNLNKDLTEEDLLNILKSVNND